MARALIPVVTLLAAASANAQTKGPWWTDVDTRGGVLRAEVASPSELSVELRAEGGEPITATSAGAEGPDGKWLHVVEMRTLEANTRYEGRVRGGGIDAAVSLHTAPEGDAPLSFLVYGDDRTNHAVHRRLVEQMQQEDDPRFVLHTGDYVEVGGRPGDWSIFFRIASPLLSRVPIYPTLGNHEIYGPGGRMRYDRYLNTPERREAWQAWTYGPLRLISLDSNDDWLPGGAQHEWLKAELADRKGATFVIVFVHHGPRSSGRHGDQREMAALGIPELLGDAGVDLVLSGHDHMYERGDYDGLKYVVTGGGGAPLYDVNRQHASQLSFQVVHHYLRFRVEGDRLSMDAIRLGGELMERCSFRPSEPWECEQEAPIDPGTPPTNYRWVAIPAGLILLGIAYLLWRRRVKVGPR
ncbi:MAG: metallophosphoesterase [Myxococcota bacterium]